MEERQSICGPETRLGLGCWAIGGYGWGKADDADSREAINCAFDSGVRLFDTADCYGLGHSEKLLAKALGANRHQARISTKGGIRWDDSGRVWKDNSPAYLRQALEDSLRRLQLDCIPLYFVHWPDGTTPIAEVITELEKMKADGLVQSVGLSNFTFAELEEAGNHGKVDVIQVKGNLISRSEFLELLPICQHKGTNVMAFGVLAEGLLTGKFTPDTVFPIDDHRSNSSEFQGSKYLENLDFVTGLQDVADQLQAPLSNVALKVMLDQLGVDCALFGAKNPEQVRQNLACLNLDLTLVRKDLSHLIASFGYPPLQWRED